MYTYVYFIWHIWYFRKKIRHFYIHCSNVPKLSSSQRNQKHMHLFSFHIQKVMNFYRGLSPIVICNAKCSVPKNNLRDCTPHNYANRFFLKNLKSRNDNMLIWQQHWIWWGLLKNEVFVHAQSLFLLSIYFMAHRPRKIFKKESSKNHNYHNYTFSS